MARHQSKEQKDTIERVMHEFKHGELTRGRGGKVTDPKQAIAIALHEAGASNEQRPKERRAALRQSKAKERRGETAATRKEGGAAKTKSALYDEARRRHIRGRSKMSKQELERALHAAS